VAESLYQKWPEALHDNINCNGSLPLHLAGALNPSLEVVEFIHERWPEVIQVRDKRGGLPLHCAAWDNHSLEVVEFLYQKDLDAIQEKNNRGDLALHDAVAKDSFEVAMFVAKAWPEALWTPNDDWNSLYTLLEGQTGRKASPGWKMP
jgi:ankyrin repeat protein